MEAEASIFETSEMMANFLGSTQLLPETWKLCSIANTTAPESFVMDHVRSTGFIAFSGIRSLDGSESYPDDLVSPVSVHDGLFSTLDRHPGGEEEPVKVHAGLLKLFFSVFDDPNFQTRMKALVEKSRSVILTGHSTGGTTASLMALILLSFLENVPSPPQVLCITFGSPLLGNESFLKAILRHRWSGSFCHVVMKHDIVPRLLFALLAFLNTQLLCLLQLWRLAIASLHSGQSAVPASDPQKAQLLCFVLRHVEARANAAEQNQNGLFWPFGNYFFCSEEGAVCVDSAVAVINLLHLMLATATATSCINDHLKYGECTADVSLQFTRKKDFMQGNLPKSSYEAGIALALESSSLLGQESIARSARDCLRMVRQMGLTPNLSSAKLAIDLAKITPNRAQIEWYKAHCDHSDDQMGYYDSFKRNQASKREAHVNICRIKLAVFWDKIIAMIDNNELPYDFNKRGKFVNAAHFYQLLVEPLDIANYYRSGMHQKEGHYLQNGRERRHEIFDKWWREREGNGEQHTKRSKFASLTQDSCFWARVEEARETLKMVRSESNSTKLVELWESIGEFEWYAQKLIESKEVSVDVLAKNSSYSLWVKELEDLKVELQQLPPQFLGFSHGEAIPRSR
ncbi:Lipase-like pad4 [Ancistrocladus abbreviatus]